MYCVFIIKNGHNVFWVINMKYYAVGEFAELIGKTNKGVVRR
jgi:hypothetical protein